MRNFIINLFSNRFGIVLATLNVCYFASEGFAAINTLFGKMLACANLPAIFSAVLSVGFVRIFHHGHYGSTEVFLVSILLASLIVLQWLLIALVARKVAQRFNSTKL